MSLVLFKYNPSSYLLPRGQDPPSWKSRGASISSWGDFGPFFFSSLFGSLFSTTFGPLLASRRVQQSTKKRCKVASAPRFQIHLILGPLLAATCFRKCALLAQNIDFILVFVVYYANRIFSFLVVSASSFAPPWAQF